MRDTEHRDAVAALSALLAGLDAPAGNSADEGAELGTAGILQRLSPPNATIKPQSPRQAA